jgi:hypothetical protein
MIALGACGDEEKKADAPKPADPPAAETAQAPAATPPSAPAATPPAAPAASPPADAAQTAAADPAAKAAPAADAGAADKFKPAELIFESRHLDLIGKGTGVKYKFEHTVSDEKLMGAPFADDITLNVQDVNGEGRRKIDVTVFTGDRQRPVQNYDEMTINPVFVWFLDKCIENFRLVSGGKQPYLKGRMSESFVTQAKLEDVEVDFGGKKVSGQKVTIVPFETDPNKHKMQGFENSKFTFIMSKDIPGYFYELQSDIFSSQAGTGKMQDRLVLVEAK